MAVVGTIRVAEPIKTGVENQKGSFPDEIVTVASENTVKKQLSEDATRNYRVVVRDLYAVKVTVCDHAVNGSGYVGIDQKSIS